jgi:NADH-quinone oxidoreductase subunit N
VKYLTFLPEALVVAGAVTVLLSARLRPAFHRRMRTRLPWLVAALLLVALGVELWAGATVASYYGGGLLQDRFALFMKASVLVATAIAIAAADWPVEDSLSFSLAMPMLAAFGVMVTASAGDFVGVWVGVEVTAAAGLAMLALRRPDQAMRLLIAGGAAGALLLLGLSYVYATSGTADLTNMRQMLAGVAPTLPLAIPVALAIGALAFRASLGPLQVSGGASTPAASPLSAALVTGLSATAALVAAVKITAALGPVATVFGPFLELVAGLTMLGGGAAALAVRAPRARTGFLAAAQAGWVLAGLATHYQAGTAAAVFLLGAMVIAATAGPAVMGALGGSEAAMAGLGTLRPHRAVALSLCLLSLAGVPPLAGFFGEFTVASALAGAGRFELLAAGLVSGVLCVVAAIGTIRVLYLVNPLEESRRAGVVLPLWSRLSAAGAVALAVVIPAYALFANPILGLAYQSAAGLGLH